VSSKRRLEVAAGGGDFNYPAIHLSVISAASGDLKRRLEEET